MFEGPMSNWNAQIRQMEATRKRQERDARKRQKELEKALKEQAKLSALEKAKLEVEAWENGLELLLSIHKEQSAPFDWNAFACALQPHEPPKVPRHELAALLNSTVSAFQDSTNASGGLLETARHLDEQGLQTARDNYRETLAHWDRTRSLARRVLAGESRAYSEAISEFSGLSEVSNLGSSINVTVRSPKVIECILKVNGRSAIPTEVKSLTASGKVSVKAMPKARFHEIYQDYVCGCVLRVSREFLALLPIEAVIVTAMVDGTDTRTGYSIELPVLSVSFPRAELERLNFEKLDPSDSIENFLHRGDVKASRKSGEFVPIEPLSAADLTASQPDRMDLEVLLTKIRQFRCEIANVLKPVPPQSTATPIHTNTLE